MLNQQAANENSSTPSPLTPQGLIDHEHLRRWLRAGRCMGLVNCRVVHEQGADQVVVWVRETSLPAYVVAFEAGRWTVLDAIRDTPLRTLSSLEAALAFIRPVLPRPIVRRKSQAAARAPRSPAESYAAGPKYD